MPDALLKMSAVTPAQRIPAIVPPIDFLYHCFFKGLSVSADKYGFGHLIYPDDQNRKEYQQKKRNQLFSIFPKHIYAYSSAFYVKRTFTIRFCLFRLCDREGIVDCLYRTIVCNQICIYGKGILRQCDHRIARQPVLFSSFSSRRFTGASRSSDDSAEYSTEKQAVQ